MLKSAAMRMYVHPLKPPSREVQSEHLGRKKIGAACVYS